MFVGHDVILQNKLYLVMKTCSARTIYEHVASSTTIEAFALFICKVIKEVDIDCWAVER